MKRKNRIALLALLVAVMSLAFDIQDKLLSKGGLLNPFTSDFQASFALVEHREDGSGQGMYFLDIFIENMGEKAAYIRPKFFIFDEQKNRIEGFEARPFSQKSKRLRIGHGEIFKGSSPSLPTYIIVCMILEESSGNVPVFDSLFYLETSLEAFNGSSRYAAGEEADFEEQLGHCQKRNLSA